MFLPRKGHVSAKYAFSISSFLGGINCLEDKETEWKGNLNTGIFWGGGGGHTLQKTVR